jgi:hypothetical protein
MRNKFPLSVFLATFIAAASHAAPACPLEQPLSFLGNPAPAEAPADKIIVITDETRYVNVTGGTTVKFIVGNRSFNWSFQNAYMRIVPFDLRRIAPRDLLTHPVQTYVAEDPLYQG